MSSPVSITTPPLRCSAALMVLMGLTVLTIETTAEVDQRGLAYLPWLGVATGAAVVLALLAAGWIRWALGWTPALPARWEHAAQHLVRFVPAVVWLDTILVYPPMKPATWTLATGSIYLAALVTLAALAAVRRVPRPAVWAAALAVGLAARVWLVAGATDALQGDLQALVNGGAAVLLRGEAPYRWYHVPWGVPLTYWPGTLLAYVPGRALGLHPRWTNLVAEAAAIALLAAAAIRRRDDGDARSHLDHPALCLVGAAYLLQGPIEWLRATAHVPGWTLLAAALLASARRHRAAGLAWGLALAASPFSAPFFPLVALAVLRERGWRAALVTVAQALVVALALVLPFALWTPRAFFEGTISWFGDVDRFPALKWSGPRTWREYPGLAGLFWTLGWQRWMQPLQVAVVGALLALFFRRRGRLETVPAYGVGVWIAFMLTNHMLWPYFYQPAIVAALCAAVTAKTG